MGSEHTLSVPVSTVNLSGLPTMEARLRYARYIAARYSAFDVYFLVSGEWHAEINKTPGETTESIKQQFIEIGNALRKPKRMRAPKQCMPAIH